MMSARDNELLTRVGPGTPMGELMRQYWIPAAMSSELKADGDPMRLMLLGEKLIAFRDSSGKVGIMDHRCPHRCASLFFGRNEEGGIRCVYHGWKFDTQGNCLEMANVPAHQDFRHKVKAKAYRTAERNGLIYVYMGEADEAPGLPDVEVTLQPESRVNIQLAQRNVSWLQGVEGELDTSHVGIMHFGKAKGGDFADNELTRNAVHNRTPEYVATETDYGYAYAAHRPAEAAGNTYWRYGHFLFPFWTMPPILDIQRNIMTRAYVPMDDEHTMIVWVVMKEAYPADRAMRNIEGISQNYPFLPNTTDWHGRWRLKLNAGNDFGIDREVQRTSSFTGIEGVQMQDHAVQESMGPIVDRGFEHLAPSDMMITRTRQALKRAALAHQKDGTLPKSARDPAVYRGVRGGQLVAPEGEDWLEVNRRSIAASPPSAMAAE